MPLGSSPLFGSCGLNGCSGGIGTCFQEFGMAAEAGLGCVAFAFAGAAAWGRTGVAAKQIRSARMIVFVIAGLLSALQKERAEVRSREPAGRAPQKERAALAWECWPEDWF